MGQRTVWKSTDDSGTGKTLKEMLSEKITRK